MVRVAEDLNDGKELQGLEMGILYTKLPDSIKKEILTFGIIISLTIESLIFKTFSISSSILSSSVSVFFKTSSDYLLKLNKFFNFKKNDCDGSSGIIYKGLLLQFLIKILFLCFPLI